MLDTNLKSKTRPCIFCGNEVRIHKYRFGETEHQYYTFSCYKCGACNFYTQGIRDTPLRFTFPKTRIAKLKKARQRTIKKLMELVIE